jgi:hypothetical protein
MIGTKYIPDFKFQSSCINFLISVSIFRLPTSDFRLSTSVFRLPTSFFQLSLHELHYNSNYLHLFENNTHFNPTVLLTAFRCCIWCDGFSLSEPFSFNAIGFYSFFYKIIFYG